MPTYFYTAVSPAGEQISGTETAESERELAHILHGKGYILTTGRSQGSKKRFSVLGGFFGVRAVDKLLFVRNLQVMISAAVSLPKALNVLSEQTQSRRFGEVLADIRKKVMGGQSMSQAMEAHPAVFPELFTSMIKVGEESGTMEDVLSHLTLQLERQHELFSKIQGALLYPAVIVTAMIGIGILMLIMVIPKLASTFEEFGLDLPLTTRAVIGLSAFLSQRWYVALPGFILFLVLSWRALKTKTGKRTINTLELKIPIVSGIVRKTNSALMTRTLSSLIVAGVPIVRALEITSQVVGNIYFRESLTLCAQQVAKGLKVSQALRPYEGIYPPMVIQMVEVGEETGKTSEVLGKLAEFFEEEVANVTKNLTSIIEPILMLVIGTVVGFFAISMIQPMYSMLSAIK